jgi:hypothetical protein
MKKVFLAISFGALMLASSAAFAEEPAMNVNQRMHPNLATAQRLSNKAYQEITAAQNYNRRDMQGHAQKAKELLVQANYELKLAAEAANENRHR